MKEINYQVVLGLNIMQFIFDISLSFQNEQMCLILVLSPDACEAAFSFV